MHNSAKENVDGMSLSRGDYDTEKWNNDIKLLAEIKGLRNIVPKIVIAYEQRHINEGMCAVLIFGREKGLSSILGVCATASFISALFLSFLSPQLAFPPSNTSIPLSTTGFNDDLVGAIITTFYLLLLTISISFHILCIMSTVHCYNWWSRFRTDVDLIKYCLDHDLGKIRDDWVILPMVYGTIAGVIACIISGANALEQRYLVIPLCVVVALPSSYMLFLSKPLGMDKVINYTRHKPEDYSDDFLRDVIEVYKEKAKLDKKLFGGDGEKADSFNQCKIKKPYYSKCAKPQI